MLELREHRLVVRRRDLQVLGRVEVRDVDRLVEIADHDRASDLAERAAGVRPSWLGKPLELRRDLGLHLGEQLLVPRDEQRRRVEAVLGLVQQVGREQAHIGAPVGDHETLRRAEDHERDAAVALHLDLRGLHGRAALARAP